MANKELSAALPLAQGLRVVTVPYENNTFYPQPDPPVPAPCLVLIDDAGSLFDSFLYVELDGEVVPLVTGFYTGGS